MARLMIMNRVSRRLGPSWLTLAIAGMAVLGVLTACSGSHGNRAPQDAGMTTAPAAGMKDGVAAPAPEFGPRPPPDAQRDVVKTASMTITVFNTPEAVRRLHRSDRTWLGCPGFGDGQPSPALRPAAAVAGRGGGRGWNRLRNRPLGRGASFTDGTTRTRRRPQTARDGVRPLRLFALKTRGECLA
jgi:hypothetical protein